MLTMGLIPNTTKQGSEKPRTDPSYGQGLHRQISYTTQSRSTVCHQEPGGTGADDMNNSTSGEMELMSRPEPTLPKSEPNSS